MTAIGPKIRRLARSTVCTPFNRVLNLIDPPVVVLLYHRVAILGSDPEMLAVSPDNFRTQMRYLKETIPLVRFEEDWTKLSRPAVAITFDDGYADNVQEALPILEEVGVPATFFVSTGAIGTLKEFWWHELEHIILEKHHLPASFTISGPTRGRTWPTCTERERREFYQDIVRLMNEANIECRNDWLMGLRRWAGTEEGATAMHRAMTHDELRYLAANRWVTVGAHTVTHSRLASLSPDEQRHEIVASKKQLEQWLKQEITVFSYPFGKRCDYTRRSVEICRETGFTKAASNFPGQAHRWTDPYRVPRHLVRDWPVELFAEKLRGFWTR